MLNDIFDMSALGLDCMQGHEKLQEVSASGLSEADVVDVLLDLLILGLLGRCVILEVVVEQVGPFAGEESGRVGKDARVALLELMEQWFDQLLEDKLDRVQLLA